jgi:hypothetical protein
MTSPFACNGASKGLAAVHSSPEAQITQLQLRLQYQDLVRRGVRLPEFADVEFRCYSQNGEDGIILYIFSLIGLTNRKVVEICAGDGIECNAANLIVNHGFEGLLFDGDPENVARGQAFYRNGRNTFVSPPTLVQAWVTAENVDSLVAQHGFGGPVDLLSLDVDGNDYWILSALTGVKPNAIVLEFNGTCGGQRAVTMSYRPDYQIDLTKQPHRCGASLAAFVKLLRPRGYRLVGVQSLGFNAFFVRNGLGDDLMPERTPDECYRITPRLQSWSPQYLDLILSGPEPWEEV